MKNLLFILILFPALVFAQQKDYKKYDKAVAYFNDGKVEKAKKITEKLIINYPDWRQPHLLMASIYTDEGAIEAAAEELLEVYDENDPKDVLGLEQVAKLYYTNAYYKNALYYFEKANTLNSSVLGAKTPLFIQNCSFALEAIKVPQAFNPENLGATINTAMEEYLPALSVDGNTLVITRRVAKKDKVAQEDFYSATKDEMGNWELAIPFKNGINTPYNEGAFSFSADKEVIVYTACNRNDGKGRCDLYLYVNNKSFNAGKNINTKYWESQGCFSPDGRYLYFISNRPGGYGGKDIWRSEITKKGFLPAENLGTNINTKYDEMSPFIHPDNLTFYFSSNGHVGMGDYDLFVSRRITSEQEWAVAENMGYPINTHNTENSLIVASNGKTAYYASNVSGFGKEDIFQFELPENLQAEPLAALEIDIITQKAGEEVILKNVSFASNSSKLEAISFIELDKLITYLKKNPNLQLEIQGHTDDIGNEIDNQILSEQRAKAVFDYLQNKVPNTLTYKGYGESQSLVTNEDKNSRAINRRTSFVILR